jgi:3-hydroxyisobutyrate dehydrogenase
MIQYCDGLLGVCIGGRGGVQVTARQVKAGFIGLGIMGQPMALNLRRAGIPLIVWNRTGERTETARAAGAIVAETPEDAIREADIVFLMLSGEETVDQVLQRRCDVFGERVHGRTLVNMGTVSPAYSAALSDDIRAAGGEYLEAPVSGSRGPAEAGELIGMLAGEGKHRAAVEELMGFMCSQVVPCGPVPGALRMKLAVNLFLITMVTGLVEAFHFAKAHRLDLASFFEVLDAGPMASSVSRMKGRKLLVGDLQPQAAIADVLKNNRLVWDAAREARIASPLLDICYALYRETMDAGLSGQDMVAVLHALEARSAHEAKLAVD